jgi:colanic acid biosynthesis glycosyl transferase WcaI
MKILIVCQYYPPEPFRVGDLAHGLREQGFDVTVLTGFPNYPQGKLYKGYSLKLFSREDDRGVVVWRVPLFPYSGLNRWLRMLNYFSFMFSASILAPFLVGLRYDAIISFQLSPVTMSVPALVVRSLSGFRIPIYHWVQDIWPESLAAAGFRVNPFIIRMIRGLVRVLYHQSEKVVVQSLGFVDRILEYGIPQEKVKYLPNWAEDLYKPVSLQTDFATSQGLDSGFHVLFAGNIGVAQGLETIIDCAKMLSDYKDIKFVILGDGANLNHLMNYAKDSPNIVFKGRKPLESMPMFFAHADVLLVHLRKDPLFSLTIPSKIQSYLACGKVILGGLEGSGRDVIAAAGGVVCEPENPTAMKNAILEIYNKSMNEREEMGFQALKYYNLHFSRQRILDQLTFILTRKSV